MRAMSRRSRRVRWLAWIVILACGCSRESPEPSDRPGEPQGTTHASAAPGPAATAPVTDTARIAAAVEADQWLSHGGTYQEQRFSRLEQIDDGNVGRLPLHSQALTGVWTNRIERVDIFRSLYNRHTWAVWDTRALVYFAVNGAQAGDEIPVARGSRLRGRVKLSVEVPLHL